MQILELLKYRLVKYAAQLRAYIVIMEDQMNIEDLEALQEAFHVSVCLLYLLSLAESLPFTQVVGKTRPGPSVILCVILGVRS